MNTQPTNEKPSPASEGGFRKLIAKALYHITALIQLPFERIYWILESWKSNLQGRCN